MNDMCEYFYMSPSIRVETETYWEKVGTTLYEMAVTRTFENDVFLSYTAKPSGMERELPNNRRGP